MKVKAPPLLPILRSAGQARLLTALLLSPEREFTLSALAEEAKVSLSTVTREVQRAETAGVVETRVVGRSRLARARREGVLVEALSRLLLVAFGPATVAREGLAAVPGIESAWVFGSWAARHEGLAGPPPNDLDLLVVGEPERDAVYAAAERIERRILRPVHVTFRTSAQWERPAEDTFLTEVTRRPLVQVAGGGTG
ncbi:MAG: ArsR family transcriptional regulator [Acidimicrobiia bacterium]|jgi:DNA-binding transcriptional ArsR family regulator|nr:ArsR family transcriptional regulator [Acidimicrobiia bacterium]